LGRADFTTGLEPRGIAVGDFNGDGKPDLVVTNSTDNTISVLLGKADGTFNPKVDYPTGTRPVSVAIADFNQDGILDLAVTNENCLVGEGEGRFPALNCGPGTVSVFLGNGDGTFQPRVDYSTGEEPLSLVAADFNGDGKMDLAVVNANDNTLSILFGNGDGTFQAQSVQSTVAGPQFVVAADFNNDSKVDLAIIGSGVSILLGNGNGTFTSLAVFDGGGAAAVAGDFNNDGKLDLVIASGGSLSLFLGQGNGTFVLNGSYLGGEGGLVAADFNGDGNLDLAGVSSSTSNYAVSVLFGNGDGTFKSPTPYGTGPTPTGLAVADFNGDGKLDLAVTDPGCAPVINPSSINCGTAAASVSILLGIGNGSFVAETSYPTAGTPNDVVTADFNGDGKLDLATATQSTNTVSILLGNGDGTFGSATSFPTGKIPLALASADFRSNGHIDLAVVDQVCNTSVCGPGSVSILLGNGDGTFQPHVDYPVRVDPLALAVGDFNGDGKPDLAVVNEASATVSILLGNGDGTFKSAADFPTASGPLAITVGDFNRDSKLDIAVVASNGVSILLGNGDGTFQAHVDYPIISGAGGYSIATADFNADGNLDLAVGTQSQVVSILLGNGDGTFKAYVDYPAGGSFGIVRVADFNGDGKPDLALGLGFSAETSILLGNGDGTFQTPVYYRAGQITVSSLTIGDFNGDGGPDLAVADGDALTVGILTSRAFKAVFPVALKFLSQGVGVASPAQTITISNPSNVPFGFGGAVASGDFAATNNCAATVAPGSHCTISIQFSPSVTGTRSGMLTLTDTTASSPQVIPLTGTGLNGPFLTESAANLSFVATPVGSSAPSQSVTISNTGNAALNLTSIGVTGANPGDFIESNSCGSSLGSGQSCAISVKFDPTAGGTRTAAITIADNSPGSPQLINLAGTGLAPAVNLSVTSLTFPSQFTGTTSSAQNVTLSNTGNATLSIAQISVSANFTESNNCGTSLAPANSCQIGISFAPASAGTLTGSLTVTSNTGGGPATVALSGVGVTPSLDLGVSSGGSSSATVSAGGIANFALVIGGGGFAGTASVTCSGAPTGAACMVPASVSVSATTASTIAVSVTTTSRSLSIPLRIDGPWAWLFYGSLFAFSILLFTAYLRRGKLRLATIGALAVLALLVASCGGGGSSESGGNSSGTPAGTYTLIVTAASGATSQSVALTLIVQ
jgi:hypothetical protein